VIEIYLLLLSLLIAVMVFCGVKAGQHKAHVAIELKKMLFTAALTVASNVVYEAAGSKLLATIGFTMFSISIAWLLYWLASFSVLYANYVGKFEVLKKIVIVLCVADTTSFLANFVFGHVFTVKSVEALEWYAMFEVVDFTVFYYCHLAISYGLVLFIVCVLFHKTINSSRYYRIKYVGILFLFGFVVIADGLCKLLQLHFNISMIFYGFLAIMIFYYTLYFVPGELVNKIQSILIEKLDNGIIFFNEEGKCIYANYSIWRQLVGKDFDEEVLIGQAEQDYAQYQSNDKAFSGDVKSWTEQHLVDGEVRHFEVSSQKIYDKWNNYVGCYFCTLDRTEELRLYNRKIELEKESNKAKSAFLSKVSHEIRTPVNAIFGMNEMILRESTDPDILHYSDQIKSAANTLLGIINDILDFSKVEAGKMSIVKREYRIEKILRNVINMCEVQAKDKNLQFDVIISPKLPSGLFGDDVRIEQILMNLLSNAVKYTAEGTVTLKIDWVGYDTKGSLGIYIEDTGIGIKEDDIPKLFKKFERIDEVRNHGVQGTGLGLSITTYLLKMMDSELKVESVYGQGSTFFCHIPQSVVDSAPVKYPFDKSDIIKKEYKPQFIASDKNILVVDDNRLNRLVFKSLLKMTRMNIVEAESGKECLEIIKNRHFDLIFMDYMMPEMDGVETFRNMNNMEHMCKGVPVIMLTANAVEGAMESYMNEGFNDFLSKPIVPDELESLISKYI